MHLGCPFLILKHGESQSKAALIDRASECRKLLKQLTMVQLDLFTGCIFYFPDRICTVNGTSHQTREVLFTGTTARNLPSYPCVLPHLLPDTRLLTIHANADADKIRQSWSHRAICQFSLAHVNDAAYLAFHSALYLSLAQDIAPMDAQEEEDIHQKPFRAVYRPNRFCRAEGNPHLQERQCKNIPTMTDASEGELILRAILLLYRVRPCRPRPKDL